MTEPVLQTVTGPIHPDKAGITDGHSHTWISPPEGVGEAALVLDSFDAQLAELRAFAAAGGQTIIDCQPFGAGRDAVKMCAFSNQAQVMIVAATGYHLRMYYPPDDPLFTLSIEDAYKLFVDELTIGMQETRHSQSAINAGFIKIACEAVLEDCPLQLMEAAVRAAVATGAGMQVHTERGADGEHIAQTLLDFGLSPSKLILCHVDKRPDSGFHKEMASQGIALEYDTFFRPKYKPEDTTWPLLQDMVHAGYAANIIIATDMAVPELWRELGGSPGADALVTQIIPRLQTIGFDNQTIDRLCGRNVVDRLAIDKG